MSAKIFDTVDDLVANVTEGDNRAPFIVVHRNVDYFVLASDEIEALAEVFREKSKAQVGTLPADLLIAAARRAALASAPRATAVEGKAAKGRGKAAKPAETTSEPKGEPVDEPKAESA